MPIFHIATGLLWLFVAARFLLPLPLHPGLRVVFGVLLLIASQHHFLTRYFRGTSFSPEVPRPIGMMANVLFGTLLLLFVFQISLDGLFVVVSMFKGSCTDAPATFRYAIGLAALGLSILGVVQAVRVPPVKEVEIRLPNLPPEFEGYRLIQLTDLHLSRLFPRRWAQGVVERANAQNADLIVITGDLLDGSMEARRDDIEPLRALHAPDGVHVITGNHEYYFGHEAWMQHYISLGMNRLSNSHTRIARGDANLVVAGLTDSASARFDLPRPDLRRALEGVPQGAPVILLDHQPRGARRAAEAGVDLQLSGHTHGGMILGMHRIVARFNDGFVSGLYRVGKMQLYVNNGTALWNGFALRIGVPSELTVITLRRGTP